MMSWVHLRPGRWTAIPLILCCGCTGERQPFDPATPDLDPHIDPRASSFRVAVASLTAGDGVVLEGDDLSFDRDAGAVSFRAGLMNASPRPLYAPLRLIVTRVEPGSISPLDFDGRTPAGESFFDLSAVVGEDGMLLPGEMSQKTRLRFADREREPFVLGALLDSGIGPAMGAIGGSVFLDQRPNGERDREEAGIPDVRLWLQAGDQVIGDTRTDADGRYVFVGLAPGLHSVRIDARDLATATPNPLHVALVPAAGDAGQAVSFLRADFAGFRRGDSGGEPVSVLGPLRVLARGETVAESFELELIPDRALVLLAELRGEGELALAEADIVLNGQPLVTGADYPPGVRLVRQQILPDILRLGSNTLEARAVARGEREVFLVVTIR
jgi:SdrD B-like domain